MFEKLVAIPQTSETRKPTPKTKPAFTPKTKPKRIVKKKKPAHKRAKWISVYNK